MPASSIQTLLTAAAAVAVATSSLSSSPISPLTVARGQESSTVAPTVDSAAPAATTTPTVSSPTHNAANVRPTPTPLPPMPPRPDAPIESFAVGCTADGVTCVVKRNASSFLGAVDTTMLLEMERGSDACSTCMGRRGVGRGGAAAASAFNFHTPAGATAAAALRARAVEERRSRGGGNKDVRLGLPNPFTVAMQALSALFNGGDDNEDDGGDGGGVAASSARLSDNGDSLPARRASSSSETHTTAATTGQQQYYFAGSMQYQDTLALGTLHVGWDIVNMTMAEGEHAYTIGIEVVTGPEGDTWLPVRASSTSAPVASLSSSTGVADAALHSGVGSASSASVSGFLPATATATATALLPLASRYYAMGYLEGYVTHARILDTYVKRYKATIERLFGDDGDSRGSGGGSSSGSNGGGRGAVGVWVQRNKEWLYRYVSMRAAAVGAADPFSDKLSHLAMQLKGMADGFVDGCAAAGGGGSSSACPAATMGRLLANTPEVAFMAMQMFDELPDILAAHAQEEEYTPNTTTSGEGSPATQNTDPLLVSLRNRQNAGTGTAIVKMVAGSRGGGRGSGGDLIVGHASSWAPDHQTVMRQYKTYRFEGSLMIGFSARPGLLSSQDGWYMTGQGLAVAGTRLPIYDNAPFAAPSPSSLNKRGAASLPSYQSVPSFYRTLIATLLAQSTGEWAALFSRQASGSSDNLRQWLVVDMKRRFDGDGTAHDADAAAKTKGAAAAAVTRLRSQPSRCVVMLLESMVGGVFKAEDISSVVAAQGYFASYNLAYFDEIAALTGQSAGRNEAYGTHPRAVQMRAFAATIIDLASAADFLRMNNNSTNLGGIDVKLTSRNSMMGVRSTDGDAADDEAGPAPTTSSFTAYIGSGGPFAAGGDSPDVGLPDTFDFPLIAVASPAPPPQRMLSIPPTTMTADDHSSDGSNPPAEGIAGSVVGCVFGSIVVVLVTCTRFRHTERRGYRPLKGTPSQLKWLAEERAKAEALIAARRERRLQRVAAAENGEAVEDSPPEDEEEEDAWETASRRVGGGRSPSMSGSKSVTPTLSRTNSQRNNNSTASGGGAHVAPGAGTNSYSSYAAAARPLQQQSNAAAGGRAGAVATTTTAAATSAPPNVFLMADANLYSPAPLQASSESAVPMNLYASSPHSANGNNTGTGHAATSSSSGAPPSAVTPAMPLYSPMEVSNGSGGARSVASAAGDGGFGASSAASTTAAVPPPKRSTYKNW